MSDAGEAVVATVRPDSVVNQQMTPINVDVDTEA
jgi:hypothetical protein